MAFPPDGQQTESGWTENWLTLAVVAFMVTSAMVAGVVGAVEVHSPHAAGSAHGASDSFDTRPAQQTEPTSGLAGTHPLDDADSKLIGADTEGTFGAALTHGDVNGDSVKDVIVSAPRNDTANGNDSGAVYVFYGPVDERYLNAQSANVTLSGVDEDDLAGYSLAAGDVNDDGTDDIVVGAPFSNESGDAAGAAYVVYGGDLPENRSLADANHTFLGEREDRAGHSVATVNRTDGDDVLVGAPQNNSSEGAGAAYVVSDADPGTMELANATATLTGESAGDRAGWSLGEVGDFDGDGSNDFVVGAPNNSSTAPDAGAAYVVTENVSGTVSLDEAHLKLAGESARDNAGWSAAEAGDVDDDGYDDLVVGAPFNNESGDDAGAAYVVYGDNDTTDEANLSDTGTRLVGENEGDYAGYSVSSAGSGDVTCDDYDDVLVGAPGADNNTTEDAGAAYVFAGSEHRPDERQLSDVNAKFVGEAEGDHAGYAVSDAMDVTANDDEDVLVGAPFSNTGGRDAGAAYIVAGDCPEPEQETPTETPTPTEEPTSTEEPTPTEKPTATEKPTPTPTPAETPEPELEDLIVTKDCVDEDGAVTFTNPNDVEVTLTFGAVDYELAANGSSGDSVTVDDLDDGDYSWSAETEDGQNVDSGTVTIDCDDEDSELDDLIVRTDCDGENGTVTVINPNDVNVTLTFDGEEYNLTANDTTDDSVTIPDLDDGDYTWSAETEDGTSVGDGSLTVDCDEPRESQNAVAISEECEQLTVTNPSDSAEAVDFRIRNDSGSFTVDDVAPGDSVTVNVSADDYTVDARYVTNDSFGSNNVTVNDAVEATISVEACEETVPDSSASLGDCEEIVWENTADQALSVRLTNGSGVVNITSSVEPGETVTFDGLAAGDYTVEAGIPGEGWDSATVDGESSVSLSVEECEETVPDSSASLGDCEEIVWENTADQALSVRILDDDGNVVNSSSSVEPGETVTFDGLAAGDYTVEAGIPHEGWDSATVDGESSYDLTVEACIEGSASSEACGEVTVTNEGSSGATARLVDEDGDRIASHDLDADGGQHTFTDVEPGTYDVTLNGQVIGEVTVAECDGNGGDGAQQVGICHFNEGNEQPLNYQTVPVNSAHFTDTSVHSNDILPDDLPIVSIEVIDSQSDCDAIADEQGY